jgi:hypothetical protein
LLTATGYEEAKLEMYTQRLQRSRASIAWLRPSGNHPDPEVEARATYLDGTPGTAAVHAAFSDAEEASSPSSPKTSHTPQMLPPWDRPSASPWIARQAQWPYLSAPVPMQMPEMPVTSAA